MRGEEYVAMVESRGRQVKRVRGGWAVECPAHDSVSKSSLSVKDGDKGLLLHCFAGCDTKDVLAADGLGFADLLHERRNGNGSEIVAVYSYVDENGTALFEVCRKADKSSFPQRRPDGSWGVQGVRKVLYRLPKVIAAVAAGETVYIAEGEKDVHALERAGVVATCNPGGAGKWRSEYAETLRGADVVIVQDKDDPGRAHAADVARSLEGIAKSVSVVEAAPHGSRAAKDAADHFRNGKTVGEFVPGRGGAGQPAAKLRNPDPSRAKPVRWAWEDRIPVGRLSLMVGNEGVGKGTVIADLTAQWTLGTLAGDLLDAPCNVLIVGDEDTLDDTWTPRLYAAKADWRRIWFPPEDAAELDFTQARDVERLRQWVRDHDAKVVVFDALLDHLGGSSVDEFKAKAVRGALRPIRRLAAEEGFAAVGAMHPRKGRALAFRDLVANSHQFNAVSRSSLLLADHPEDKSRRVLIRGKGNLAGIVPALDFRIDSAVFVLNDERFSQPCVKGWRESDVTVDDVLLRGSGSMGGRPPDDAKRDAVEAALTDEPQGYKLLSGKLGIALSTLRYILPELADEGLAKSVPGKGWARGGAKTSDTGVFAPPPEGSENGSTKPNQGCENPLAEKAPDGGFSHPPADTNGNTPWTPHLPAEDAPDWWLQ